MAKTEDILGDRIKGFESLSTMRRAFKGQPIIVRLDGKAFHTFTKGLAKPYDQGLTDLMIETTKFLVKTFNANLGYTQSDEIALMFYETKDSKSEYIYGGRFQKLDSLLAAAASVYFNRGIPTYVPSKINATPVLDARSFVVPTVEDAYDVFLWRQLDATKNAVSMAAHSYFSHKSLHGMNSKQMQECLFAEKGINFNDYPYFFKRGTFVANESKTVTLTEDQLNAIPEKYRTDAKTCVRTVTTAFDMWMSSRPDQEDLSNFFYTIYKKD